MFLQGLGRISLGLHDEQFRVCLTVHINSLGNHKQISHPLLINSYPRFCHHKGKVFVVHCILQPARRKNLCLSENLNADIVLWTVGLEEKGMLVFCISLFSRVAFREM